MASGLPIIAAHSFGIVDHLAESEAGILVKPGSSKRLKEAIEQLITNPGERHQMATNARTHSETRSWDKCFQRLLQYYQGSIEQTGGRWSGGINTLRGYGSITGGQ
jgi:glycosyltransferase involved in cell wall biosynthesis